MCPNRRALTQGAIPHRDGGRFVQTERPDFVVEAVLEAAAETSADVAARRR
jgi:hypothetical protein